MTLEPKITERLQDTLSALEKDGKLLGRRKLDACYALFRERFGPDVLAGLDGEQLLETMPGYNPRNRRPPQPRPDFLVRRNGSAVAVLDAKYRDLWEHSLPREMLYQLSIYALSQVGGGKATILYPTTASTAREARISISDPLRGTKQGEVVLRPVDLLTLHRLIAAPNTAQAARSRTNFARVLAIGSSAPIRSVAI